MSRAASDNFLNKYKNINYTDYNQLIPNNYVQYQTTYTSDPLAQQVLSQAGPDHIYRHPNFHSEVSNITRINTEITHQPATYHTYQYKINEDPNPIRLVRPITPVSQKQNVKIRYLQPPELPEPHPIIIKERQLTPPPPPPPIVIRQIAKPPPTPPPLIIRERPPVQPQLVKPTFIEKIIPPPTPPQRQVIIERIPHPEKPREIIYEKWLPYKPQGERKVIVEKAKLHPRHPTPKNVIIDYEHPAVNVERQLYHEGTVRADPSTYRNGLENQAELRVVDEIKDLPSSHETYRPVYSQLSNHEQQAILRAITPSNSSANKSASTQPIPRGPVSFSGPWNTTYRSSFTGRGFGY